MIRKKAFMLVELPVVMTIIDQSLSIFLPAVRRVRQHAAGVMCLSNFCQLVTFWQSYFSDIKNQIVYGHVLFTSVPDTTRRFEVHFPQTQSGDYLGEAAALKCEYERIGIRIRSVFNARIEADSNINLNDPNSCSDWPLGPGANGVPATDPNSTTYVGIRVETTRPNATDSRNLGSASPNAWVVYQVSLAPGTYDVYAAYSLGSGTPTISFGATATTPVAYGTCTFPSTGGWDNFVKIRVGQITIPSAITSIRLTWSASIDLDWFSFDLQ